MILENFSVKFTQSRALTQEELANKVGVRRETIVFLKDGKTIWSYDPKNNEVTKMDMPKINNFNPSEQDYIQSIRELLNQTDISYQGSDKFEGRSVYLIKAAPKKEGMMMGMHFSMWVDNENWMPLKIETFDFAFLSARGVCI